MSEVFNPTIYRQVWEIGLGTALLLAVLFIHGAGMFSIQRAFNRLWPRVVTQRHQFLRKVFMGAIVLSLLGIHFIEILLWASTLFGIGGFSNLRTAFYFAGGAYTTYGSGSVELPENWRLLGFMIATSGLFTFGWTTGILVSIVTKFFDTTRGPEFHPTADAARPPR